jgi:hypothetical protein
MSRFRNNTSLKIFIYDMHGNKKFFNECRNAKSAIIDIANFSAGNYLIRAVSDEQVYQGMIYKN